MSDLRERLDDLADSQTFTPVLAAAVAAAGRRALQRRRRAVGAGALAAVLVAGAGLRLGLPHLSTADLGFAGADGRGGRVPAVGVLDGSVTFPDLVTSVRGKDGVEIEGFGWPIEGREPVSDATGALRLPALAKLDAESMCLPMLEQAAPEVPAEGWQHSTAWVDRFPSRATLPITVEAEHAGRAYHATCILPGDYVPGSRPELERVPAPADREAILDQCSYLGHVDLRGWSVVTATSAAGRTVAALRSANGYAASCGLSAEPAGRFVQVSEHREPPDLEDMMIYDQAVGALVMAGLAPLNAASVEVRIGRTVVAEPVVDSMFAMAVPSRTADPVARFTAYDSRGSETASWSTITLSANGRTMLLPSDCFYSSQRDPGAC